MEIKFKKALNIAFPNTRRKVGGISVSREGDRVFIDFETEKGQKLPGFVALPVDCLEQLVHAINCARETLVAEHHGIQMVKTWADGEMDVVLRITDAEAAEVWRGRWLNDWLILAGVGNEYAFVHNYDISGISRSEGWRLISEYKALSDKDGHWVKYEAENIFEDGGMYANPFVSLFEDNVVVFRNIR